MFEWDDDDDEDEDDASPVRSPPREPTDAVRWLQAVLVVLAVGWALATSWQVLLFLGDLAGGAADGVSESLFRWWPSETGWTWAGRADAQRHARRVMLLSLLPAAGVLLALAGRRSVAAGLLGIGAVVGLLVGAGLHAAVTPDLPDVPERRAPYCGEHSGEPARCPGG